MAVKGLTGFHVDPEGTPLERSGLELLEPDLAAEALALVESAKSLFERKARSALEVKIDGGCDLEPPWYNLSGPYFFSMYFRT